MNSSILCAKFTIFSGKGKPISRRLSHPTLRDSRRLNSHAFGIPSFWWVPPHVQYPPHPQNAGVTTAVLDEQISWKLLTRTRLQSTVKSARLSRHSW